jgi:hypothetical protein
MHTVPASEQWMWAALAGDDTIVHVWPLLDVLQHVAEPECPCLPEVKPLTRHGEAIGSCVIHKHHYLMN